VRSNLPLPACLAITGFLTAAAQISAQQPLAPNKAPRLFALLVIDTDSNLGNSVLEDRNNVRRVLQEGFATRPHRLVLDVLEGPKVTRERVLAYYRDLKGQVRPDDTLLCYYSGHGATLADQGGQCLAMTHDLNTTRVFLARKDLRLAMESLSPRLTVILTDCCSKVLGGVRGKAITPPPPAKWPAMDFLFFQHRGVTDINACQEDALAWSYTDDKGVSKGGAFTLALVPLLCKKKEDFKPVFGNEDGFLTWAQFAKRLRVDTDELYQPVRTSVLSRAATTRDERMELAEANRQKVQEPQLVALAEPAPRPITDKTWLFGVEHTRASQGNKPVVVVLKVYPNTPAAEAGVKDGDVIRAVDGQPITTTEDLDRALENSEGVVTVDLLRAGRTERATVHLRPVKPRAP
jgi:hypothetical protein